MIKTIHKFCIFSRIQNIPHFCFAKEFPLLVSCIFIIRVHLHRKILLRINKLDQNRKFTCLKIRITPRMFSDKFRKTSQKFCKFHSLKLTTCNNTWSIRMCRAFPCLRQRLHINIFRKIII